jgi:tRNA threonylcarbamoyladenosine biosynthesis protein TsaE
VEWGEGLAELLADDRLEVTLTRATGGAPGDEARTARVVPVGARWVGAGLSSLVA